jgi:hypothetical protein
MLCGVERTILSPRQGNPTRGQRTTGSASDDCVAAAPVATFLRPVRGEMPVKRLV